MPADYEPEREMSPTTVELTLHGPECYVLWAQDAATIKDVFGSSWLTDMRRFQAIIDGQECWVSAEEAAALLARVNGAKLTNMMREPDGLVRPVTPSDFEHLRRHMDASVQVA